MKNLLISISALTLMAWSGCNQEAKLDTCYRNSVAWMWSQQGEDGGWHSQTHAVLRDGRALTPYILYYLLQVPLDVYPRDSMSVKRGIHFIDQDMWKEDTLISDNYPNYAACYALRIYVKTKINSQKEKLIRKYLQDQQFLERRGATSESMAYGGWGYGEPDLKQGEFGHVDISHTRRIIEALRDGMETHSVFGPKRDALPSDTVYVLNKNAALLFLQGCQRSPRDKRLYEGCTDRAKIPYDGGFVSSMYTLSTNKCQPYNVGDCYHYPSYATATCDGLLALHALYQIHHPDYSDAVKWLTEHQRIDVIEGLSEDDPEQWYLIMHYYHWAVRAEAMRAAGIHGQWEIDLKKALVKEQREDGSYINPLGGVNKEDDPLMATIFCVQAMRSLLPPSPQ